jgi:hypothetical protein
LRILYTTAFRVLACTALVACSHASATESATPNPAIPPGGQAWSPTSTVGTASPNSGKAKLCALDDVKFDTYKEISIPATSAFKDWGAISASKDDPDHWAIPHGELPTGEHLHAAFVTLDAVTLSKANRCAETRVKMLIAPLASDGSQTIAVNHLFALDDVLDYPIPTKRPPIEIGELIDDMSIFAVLTADVNEAFVSTKTTMDDAERAAKCLDGAQKLAAYVNAGVGTPTSSVAPLTDVPSSEASYGCPFGPKDAPDLFVAWDHQAHPPADTVAFIAKAGEYLTGATNAELKIALAACVTEALKLGSREMGDREFRGVKVECQAFMRDGGGGSATIYRRFGAYPVHLDASAERRAAMLLASEKAKIEETRSRNASLAFAKWWLDPAIPQKVKTFAMVSARIVALSERCPTWTPNLSRIAEAAAYAGVQSTDIKPGGKYFALVAMMTASMRSETEKQSVDSACEDAQHYD